MKQVKNKKNICERKTNKTPTRKDKTKIETKHNTKTLKRTTKQQILK